MELRQLKAFAETLELAKGQLQMLHPLPENARMEIKSNLIAAEARARHLIARAEFEERRAERQAEFDLARERKAHAAGG